MPLDKSGSKASVGKNIAREESAGRPRRQAIAIALETKRRARKGGNYKRHWSQKKTSKRS